MTCPEKGTIKATMFGSAGKHAANEPFCVIDIHKNTNRGEGLVARDTGNGTIDITGTIENIVSDRSSPTGSILCTKKEETGGVLHVDLSVTGRNEAFQPTSISLTHN